MNDVPESGHDHAKAHRGPGGPKVTHTHVDLSGKAAPQSLHHDVGHAIAARAQEREHAAQGFRQGVVPCRAQEAARTMQARLHGLGAQVEAGGGFLDRAVLGFAHREHDPERFGQLVDVDYASKDDA